MHKLKIKVCFIVLGTVVHYTLFLYIFLKVYYYFNNKLVLNLLLGADPENSEKGGWDTRYLFILLIFFKNNRSYHRRRGEHHAIDPTPKSAYDYLVFSTNFSRNLSKIPF